MNFGGTWTPENRTEIESNIPNFKAKGLNLYCGSFVSSVENENRFLLLEGQLFDSTIQQAILEPSRLETAYGYYGYVWYDKTTEEIRIGTDRFGFFPIYYAFENDVFIFGSSINFVKDRLKYRSPDYEAWEEIFVLGEVIGEKSTVKQIKRLSEGTQIQIKDGKVSFRRYWQPEIPEPVDEATYIRENNKLLDEAMSLTANQTRPKIVLLSGGEDSRRIALASVRQGLDADFFTQETVFKSKYTHWVDADVKLSVKLSDMLKRPHFIESLPNNSQFFEDWKARDSVLGFECVAHEWLWPLVRRITTPSLIYDGIVGDITINGHYFKHHPQAIDGYKDIDALAHMIYDGQNAAWVRKLRTKTETPLVERVKQLLNSYPDNPHRLNFYYIFNHTRRKISCASQFFALQNHWICYPYLYYPLFFQSLSLDPRLQLKKYHQRECMAALSPEIISVPTTRETPLPSEWLIPRDHEKMEQLDFLYRHLMINDEVLDIFPNYRARYRALDAYRKLTDCISSKAINWPLRRYGWFFEPLSRYSSFLEWLKN